MSQQSTGLSDGERRNARSGSPKRLLYSREQTAEVLGGVSIATVKRLEREGRLTPIRLSRSPTGQVFHRAAEVHGIAGDTVSG